MDFRTCSQLVCANKEDSFIDFKQYMVQWESGSVEYENLTLPLGCWRYRGEGNANIVIALTNESTIIRLSKHYNDVSGTEKQWKRKVERQVIFSKHIFTPLLGDCFVAQVKAVYIPPDQIAHLNDCLGRIRPQNRMQKELKVPYATAHNDFARLMKFSSNDVDYCIEIKPKKGWWSSPNCSDVSRPQLCTYCLNQYLKLKKSKITHRSNYCPLDLFSGDPSRTVCAVISLLANPQNNFRIFRDGSLVYSDANRNGSSKSLSMIMDEWMSACGSELSSTNSDTGFVKNLVYLICIALLKPQEDDYGKGTSRFIQIKEQLEDIIRKDLLIEKLDEIIFHCGQLAWRKCKNESHELPSGSVLSKVLSAQRLEEPESKTKLLKLFRSICPVHSDSRYAADTGILSNASSEDCPVKKCLSVEAWLDEVRPKKLPPSDLQRVQRHLLATTVKDCSIMLTFSPVSSITYDWSVENGNSIIQDLNGKLHHSKVGIVDLDPKPLSALVKHYLRESEMLKAYVDMEKMN